MQWSDGIQYLKGVGPARAQKLEKLGVQTIGQLLCTYPRGYIDYSNPVPLASAPYDMPVAVKAEVLEIGTMVRISGGRTMLRVQCADDTALLTLVFFNNPYVSKKLEAGREYLFYGKIGGGFANREMIAPVFLPAGTSAPMAPVYPLTEGLSSGIVSTIVKNALAVVQNVPEPIPAELLEKYKLPSKRQALEMVHTPKSIDEVEKARRRLVFEELFILQLGMLLMRGRESALPAAPMKPAPMDAFMKALPFELTGAQKRAIEEAAADMTGAVPMNRLLQGDVGSGKTMVAAACTWLCAQNGYQTALMAPTEILARQHAQSLEKLMAPLGIQVALLTGGTKQAARKATLNAVASGQAHLVVGTHAILSEPVEFANLGLAITDEQHRFGVRQRGQLAEKGKGKAGGKPTVPHLLVMSATPIPRTLALLMFGDLDVSVLDELPPGRKPVKTRVMKSEKRGGLFGFLEKEIINKRQAYIVCPLVEEGESDLLAVQSYVEEIARPLLPNAKIGIMHGRLKAAEKAQVMDDFAAGGLDVLVSTTVIEVGVDVPNATVMVIENAERYGLSALHQLRGRVGRGAAESWCFLVSDHEGEAAKERLRFLAQTQNGFDVAKYDLETRGPGDFFGSRQHGLPALNVANLAADTRTLKAAQDEAVQLLRQNPKLSGEPLKPLVRAVEEMFSQSMVMN